MLIGEREWLMTLGKCRRLTLSIVLVVYSMDGTTNCGAERMRKVRMKKWCFTRNFLSGCYFMEMVFLCTYEAWGILVRADAKRVALIFSVKQHKRASHCGNIIFHWVRREHSELTIFSTKHIRNIEHQTWSICPFLLCRQRVKGTHNIHAMPINISF